MFRANLNSNLFLLSKNLKSVTNISLDLTWKWEKTQEVTLWSACKNIKRGRICTLFGRLDSLLTMVRDIV